MIRFQSWNVNGMRALRKKPEWDWFLNDKAADIVGIQETKAHVSQISEEDQHPRGCDSYFASSEVKKGYSGVAVFTKNTPLCVEYELPVTEFQGEGRIVHLEFPKFHYFNGYFPNGGEELSKGVFKRVPYKMGFFDAFLQYAEDLRYGRTPTKFPVFPNVTTEDSQKLQESPLPQTATPKPIIVCGDFNIAHHAIDLARPKDNSMNTGFLQEERDFLDKMTSAGYIDTFRHVHGDSPDAYTWWSYKTKARERNIGWRIDYFFVSEELKPFIHDAWIENHVYGSDHCPVGLSLNMEF